MKSFKDLRQKTNESWGDKMPKSERPGWVKDPKTGKWVKPTQVKKEAVEEKTLTPAEKKKREEIAKAMERENPGMDMKKKMAIATATAKKVAEEVELDEVLDTPKAMDSYRNKAKYSKDRAANSAAAKMLRNPKGFHSTDTSDELKTMDKRTKGLKMADKAAARKTRAMLMKKEEVELDEGIEKMSHSRLKWHMNTGVPHGSYTKDEMKKERDRRLSRVDTHAAYKKAKPSMNEGSELEEGLYHVEYGRSGKLTHQVVAKDAKDAHQKAMAHLKKKNPKLAHPDYADTFHKPSITHIKGNEPRADKYKTESVNEAADPQMDKIKQLVRLGLMDKGDMTKIVRALNLMNAGKTVPPTERGILFTMLNELIGMITGDQTMFQKARKAVQEAYEDDEPASPDEAGMAMSQLDFIAYASDEIADYIEEGAAFPEWFQNKLTGTYESMKDLHAYMEGENSGGEDDDEDEDEEDMNEAVVSADKKPEKYIKPDGSVGIRMTPVNKNVVKKDA